MNDYLYVLFLMIFTEALNEGVFDWSEHDD